MNFIREKRIYCGNYLEVDLIPKSRTEKISRKRKRSRKKKLSAPKQKNLNDKNARRYFIQLVNTNLGESGLHITLTYSRSELPSTLEAAEKEVENYIARINYRRKKEGLQNARYMYVTEYLTEKETDEAVRIHHHIFMDADLSRDIVEDLWRRRRKKGEKKGKKIGIANANRLQADEQGLTALGNYLMKYPRGKKRWRSSQKLIPPYYDKDDHKYSKREVERAAKNPEDREYWEKKYPGYWFTECKPVYNDLTGWSIYLKFRKIPGWKKGDEDG